MAPRCRDFACCAACLALLLAVALPARLAAEEAPPAAAATPATPSTAATATTPATPPVQLPEGSGRPALEKTCLGCHPADRIVALQRTPEQWQGIMTKMMEQGAMASDEDFQSIYDYLVTHYGQPAANQ